MNLGNSCDTLKAIWITFHCNHTRGTLFWQRWSCQNLLCPFTPLLLLIHLSPWMSPKFDQASNGFFQSVHLKLQIHPHSKNSILALAYLHCIFFRLPFCQSRRLALLNCLPQCQWVSKVPSATVSFLPSHPLLLFGVTNKSYTCHLSPLFFYPQTCHLPKCSQLSTSCR